MRAYLADGVFMAVCDEDIVVLDTRADQYSCLPEAAEHLSLHGDRITGPEVLIAELGPSGLLQPSPGLVRRALPARPTRAFPLAPAATTVFDRLAVVRGMVDAWRAGPGRRPLDQLIDEPLAVLSDEPQLETIARLTVAFTELLPWDPVQGACLYRAWLLRRILQAHGQRAVWVFGVKTWPFGAHCWLQIDDCVLDDDPDRVALYTPIMAI